jgi:hypothetical protein
LARIPHQRRLADASFAANEQQSTMSATSRLQRGTQLLALAVSPE